MRAIRLAAAPEVDAGCEADLWFGPLVEARGVRAVSLRTDIVAALRDELAERWRGTPRDRERLDRARRAMSRVHKNASPALVLEERLAWLVIRDIVGSPLEDELWPAVAALEAERLGVARWAMQAWPRLPAPARRTRAGALMHAVAATQLGLAPTTDIARPGAAELSDPSMDWGALIGNAPRVPLLVAWTPDALRLGAIEDDNAAEIMVPDLDPVWLEVTLHLGNVAGEPIEVRLLSGEQLTLPAGRDHAVRIATLVGEEYELARTSMLAEHTGDRGVRRPRRADLPIGVRHRVTLGPHLAGAGQIAWSVDGRRLAVATDRGIALWDVASGVRVRSLRRGPRAVNAVAFEPSGQTLASVAEDGRLELWTSRAAS